MTAVVRLGEVLATVEDGVWSSADPELAKLCTAFAVNLGLHLYEPNRDLAAALRVIERVPEVELVSFVPVERVDGRVY